jgi:hypothetical protein
MIRIITFVSALAIFASCGETPVKEKEEIPSEKTIENADTLTNDSGFNYVITNNKTGEIIQMTQEEYLVSDYLNNPEFTVEEKLIVK